MQRTPATRMRHLQASVASARCMHPELPQAGHGPCQCVDIEIMREGQSQALQRWKQLHQDDEFAQQEADEAVAVDSLMAHGNAQPLQLTAEREEYLTHKRQTPSSVALLLDLHTQGAEGVSQGALLRQPTDRCGRLRTGQEDRKSETQRT